MSMRWAQNSNHEFRVRRQDTWDDQFACFLV